MPRIETTLIHSGHFPQEQHGFVSPPIYRASTVLYKSVKHLEESARDPMKNVGTVYGRFGTPSTRQFESAICQLENAYGAVCTGTGLSAVTTAILAFAKSGAHILISDSAYFPTRRFCNSLHRFGVEVEYYDPMIGSQIESLIQPQTRLVYIESPGSLTFEVQDVPAIVAVCRRHGVVSMIDNTWATPLFFQPLKLGVNMSIHSATKYITGHADSFLGIVACDDLTYSEVRACAIDLGQMASADDVHLGLRGLRTLAVRMRQHSVQALELAQWLKARPEVEAVYHPALPESLGHEIWKRDFSGSSGLFSIELKKGFEKDQVDRMINALRIFGIGHSWGGFESLIVPADPSSFRTTGDWTKRGAILRLHVGLENVQDLKMDLENGFRAALA
jgi:cystathionine beta-lyase